MTDEEKSNGKSQPPVGADGVPERDDEILIEELDERLEFGVGIIDDGDDDGDGDINCNGNCVCC